MILTRQHDETGGQSECRVEGALIPLKVNKLDTRSPEVRIADRVPDGLLYCFHAGEGRRESMTGPQHRSAHFI